MEDKTTFEKYMSYDNLCMKQLITILNYALFIGTVIFAPAAIFITESIQGFLYVIAGYVAWRIVSEFMVVIFSIHEKLEQ